MDAIVAEFEALADSRVEEEVLVAPVPDPELERVSEPVHPPASPMEIGLCPKVPVNR